MWYVIWTTARNERNVEEQIGKDVPERLYRRCWLPMKTERQKWDGEWKDVETVLFPGYLFLDTDRPEEFSAAAKKMKGYIGLLKNEDVFLPISAAEEEIIRRLTGETGCAGISTGVIENGRLRVINGALFGMEKYITRIDRHKRKAYLEMKLFGDVRRFNAGLVVVEKS